MKYYVQVNHHLMATVEAETALRAEHFFLDLDGIQYSNAFSDADRNTDTFRGALLDCETVSRDELLQLSRKYTEAWIAVAQAKDQRTIAEHEIERIQKLLDEAVSQKASAEARYQEALSAAYAAKKALSLEDE